MCEVTSQVRVGEVSGGYLIAPVLFNVVTDLLHAGSVEEGNLCMVNTHASFGTKPDPPYCSFVQLQQILVPVTQGRDLGSAGCADVIIFTISARHCDWLLHS